MVFTAIISFLPQIQRVIDLIGSNDNSSLFIDLLLKNV